MAEVPNFKNYLRKFVGSGPAGSLTAADLTPEAPQNLRVIKTQDNGFEAPLIIAWSLPGPTGAQPHSWLVEADGIPDARTSQTQRYHSFVPNQMQHFGITALGALPSETSSLDYTWVLEEDPVGYTATATYHATDDTMTLAVDNIKAADGEPFEGTIPFMEFYQAADGSWYQGNNGSAMTVAPGVFSWDKNFYGGYPDLSKGVKLLIAVNGDPNDGSVVPEPALFYIADIVDEEGDGFPPPNDGHDDDATSD